MNLFFFMNNNAKFKVIIVYFIHRLRNRKNYAFEAVNLQMQIKYLFSEQMVEQLTWGRFIKTHGLAEHNISSDLYMEHLNRYMFTHTPLFSCVHVSFLGAACGSPYIVFISTSGM